MNEIRWPNDLLEPVLITYNRSACLKRTLDSFLQAGCASMRLHVLDNASTDETPRVVKEIQGKWPALAYHRNPYNIGGNANILRAVEVSDTPYHWVIGDDDKWYLHGEDLEELFSVLREGSADIIRLGWLVSPENRGKLLPGRDLAQTESQFFASLSMISATILRRSLVTRYLAHAYLNTGDCFPQLVPVMLGIEREEPLVYNLSRDLMLHTPNEEPGFLWGLDFPVGWFRSSRFLEDPKMRRKFVNEIMVYFKRDMPRSIADAKLLFSFFNIIINNKARGLDQTSRLLSMIVYGKGWRLPLATLLAPCFLVPKFLARFICSLYDRIVHKKSRDAYFKDIIGHRESRL